MLASHSGLDQAIRDGRLQQLKYIFKDRVRASQMRTRGDGSPLALALQIEDDTKRRRIFNFLLERGVDVCHKDKTKGRDVFAWACYYGREDQVGKLMEFRPDNVALSAPDKAGLMPIHHACHSGNPFVVYQVVREMNKYSISVDIENPVDGMTPFLDAKRNGYDLIAQILQSEGNACPSQFDSKTFRTKSRWAEVGREEREEENVHRMLTEFKITGSSRPNTAYQKRRDLATQIIRPKTAAATISGMSNPSASATHHNIQDSRAKRDLYKDLHMLDVKDIVNKKVDKSEIKKWRADSDGSDTGRGSMSESSDETKSDATGFTRQNAWSRLNNLMSLSDNASSLSTDYFAHSIASADDHHANTHSPVGPPSHQNNIIITSMMTSLSQQMSTAFCKSAVAPPKAAPKPPPKPSRRRKKGSTLAFILQTMGGKPRKAIRQRQSSTPTNKQTNSVELKAKPSPCNRGQSRAMAVNCTGSKKVKMNGVASHTLPTIKISGAHV